MNMVKVLSFRLQQCFSLFTMLLVERSSSMGLFRRLSKHVFRSPSVQKHISHEGHFFSWKSSKLNLNFENAKKNSENIFHFSDNFIWKSCHKLPLLRREYLSMAVNGLTNSPHILHITRRHFFNLNCLHRDQ